MGVKLTDLLKKYKSGIDYFPKDEQDLAERGITSVKPDNIKFLIAGTGGNPRIDFYFLDNPKGNTLSFMRESINSHRSVTFMPVKQEDSQELWPFFLMAAIIIFALGWLIK